jgi:hypothetical protein
MIPLRGRARFDGLPCGKEATFCSAAADALETGSDVSLERIAFRVWMRRDSR